MTVVSVGMARCVFIKDLVGVRDIKVSANDEDDRSRMLCVNGRTSRYTKLLHGDVKCCLVAREVRRERVVEQKQLLMHHFHLHYHHHRYRQYVLSDMLWPQSAHISILKLKLTQDMHYLTANILNILYEAS